MPGGLSPRPIWRKGRGMFPLSVLDLSPVASGSTAAQALRNTLDLARLADHLGFTRYWIA